MSEKRTQLCPNCETWVTMRPYDIGSGPEMSCPQCEWCWGADGQPLNPSDATSWLSPELRDELGL